MTFQIKTRFKDFLKVMTLKVLDNAYARAFVLLLFFFSIRIDTTLGEGETGVSIEIWSLSAILFFMAASVLFFGAMKQLYSSVPKFREPLSYAFSNQGIFIRGGSFEQILDWKAISGISETRNYFLIEDENLDFFILEKKQVAGRIEALRSIMAREDGAAVAQLAY